MTSPPLHIGLLTPDLSHAHGWAHVSLSLIEALRRAGLRLTVIAAHNSPDVPDLDLHRLLPSIAPPERHTLLKQIKVMPRVWARLQGCQVIHATAEPYAPLATWVAGRRLVFVTGHGSFVQMAAHRRFPAGAIYRRALRRARLVCVSRYTARMAAAALPGVQTVVVNNGVDAARFAHLPRGAVAKHGPTVLAVGAVKPRKGTLELVRALALVRDHIPDIQGVIIGDLNQDPAYVAAVRSAIQTLGLEDRVHLLGRLSETDLLGWYAAADVFVQPAVSDDWKFEGYGLVYLEASAAGLPVIGTDGSGAEDAIDDGLTGLLVPQADLAERLPQAILQVLADPALAARLGAAGRQKAAAQTWDHVAQQLIALYTGGLRPPKDRT